MTETSVEEYSDEDVYYLLDKENPFLFMCTIQKSSTAFNIASRMKEHGIGCTEINPDQFEVQKNGKTISLLNALEFVHRECKDIIADDRFFDEDMQDNQMRILRALRILADEVTLKNLIEARKQDLEQIHTGISKEVKTSRLDLRPLK